jgi:hypothetical protein
MVARSMAETGSVTVFRVAGKGGAGQWWDGYANAVRQARECLSGRHMSRPPELALELYGEAWAREVRGYALQLTIEALKEAGR